MKSILLSIKPKWIAKILNREKTIEIRKVFPKDYKGWVYLYCTKSKPYLLQGFAKPMHTKDMTNPFNYKWCLIEKKTSNTLNGKIVARFWCEKIGALHDFEKWGYENHRCGGLTLTHLYDRHTDYLGEKELEKETCLKADEIRNYSKGNICYAIHISKLEVFDRPKELSEFYKAGYLEECAALESHFADIEGYYGATDESYVYKCYKELNKKYQLTKAPQSMCYIDVQ